MDFYFLPNLNSPYFEKVREAEIRQTVQGITEKVYALDDQSALKVVDGKVDVISDGKWFVVNG